MIEYNPPNFVTPDKVKDIPKWRVLLGHGPTPLSAWNFTQKEESHSLLIKREDLYDALPSGNKVRKMEFILPQILQEGHHDSIISIGPVNSNSCAVISIVSTRFGLKPCHVLIHASGKEKAGPGIEFFHRVSDANLHYISREEYYEKGEARLLEDKKNFLIEEGLVSQPFLLPMGGSCRNSVFAYVEVFSEILSQVQEKRLKVDEIIFATGSGSTAAGLALAKALQPFDSPLKNVKLTGCIVWDTEPSTMYSKITKLLQELGVCADILNEIENIVDFVKAEGDLGYGLCSEEERGILSELGKISGVQFDWTYTGKCVLQLVNHPRPVDTKVLFLHTGGLHSMF